MTDAGKSTLLGKDPIAREKALEVIELCEQLVGSAELGILGLDVGVLNAGIWKDARRAIDSYNHWMIYGENRDPRD